jgi:5'-deoxynucleotidase YfbR-like HD superfamily hydrolase
MDLDLKAMLTGDLSRLRHVHRFSSIFVLHKESVAEHCFFVATYALMISHWIMWNPALHDKVKVNKGRLLEKCLIHDLDEARTGDFFRPFKYSSPEIKEILERGAFNEFNRIIYGIFPTDSAPVSRRAALGEQWQTTKDLSWEGRIVAFADYLSVLSYMIGEVQCSNSTMLENHDTMRVYAESFDHESYDFIRPLVEEAQAITRDNLKLRVPAHE